jgi:hypothetical protein
MPYYSDAACERFDQIGKKFLAEMRAECAKWGPALPGRELFQAVDQATQSLTQAVAAETGEGREGGGIILAAFAHSLGVQLSHIPKERWGAALDELCHNILTYAYEVRADVGGKPF